MRLAAIYDIHGNLPALEAVLEEVRRAEVDQVVVGGDVVPGPMPRETIACLLDLDIPLQFIVGNGDREVLASMNGAELKTVPPQFHDLIHWNARQLTPDDKQLLSSWPQTLCLDIMGIGEVLFCHATPDNDTDVFTKVTPDAKLLPIFGGVSADLIVCGHSHMQFDRMTGSHRLVNAGSVGMPFGEAGAYWLLLGPDLKLCKTSYDFEKAAERIRATSYPGAEQFADQNILRPPSEEEMLQLFAKTALK